MKVILNENQHQMLIESKLLVEGAKGIDDFLELIELYHNISPEFMEILKQNIEASNCEKIEFGKFSIPALGLSLPHGVLMNNMLLGKAYSLEYLIYATFHEIGHQHQYKKYGSEFALKLYEDDIDITDAIRMMKQIENTADQFGLRKCREFSKLGNLDLSKIPKIAGYENVTEKGFTDYINMIKNKIRSSGAKTPDEIDIMMYNWIKIAP
jgi:hypothetical protein